MNKADITKKWWTLVGTTESDDCLMFIADYDHLPSSYEVDKSAKDFGENINTFVLLEEIARGQNSIKLSFNKNETKVPVRAKRKKK